MEAQNEIILYERIDGFINQFMYVYDDGITIEINEFFVELHANNKVKHFTLLFDTENHHYRVVVVVEKCILAYIHPIFLSFMKFISYSEAAIFTKKQMETGTHYEYASFSTDGRGLCCEVDFVAEETEAQKREIQRGDEDISRVSGTIYPGFLRQPALLWKYEVNHADSWPPIVIHDIVYSVSDSKDIYAIDREQGSLKWHWESHSAQKSFRIVSYPKEDNGNLYVPIISVLNGERIASLYSISTQTGQLLKQFPLFFSHRIETSHFFTVHDGVGYLSSTDNNVAISSPAMHDVHAVCQAINLQTGVYTWVRDLGEGRDAATPIFARERIYCVVLTSMAEHQHVGNLYVLNAQTGEVIWQYIFQRIWTHEIAVGDTDVFLVSTTLEILDALTGKKRWSLPDLDVVLKGVPVVDDEFICISYERTLSNKSELDMMKPYERLLTGGPPRIGGILAVDRTALELRWMVTLTQGDHFTVTEGAIIANGVLYTVWDHLDMRGSVIHATLYALDVRTGHELWRFDADSLSAPFSVNGKVFIQGRQGEKHSVFALY
jgi:outer membrane protein assembly factor BamB